MWRSASLGLLSWTLEAAEVRTNEINWSSTRFILPLPDWRGQGSPHLLSPTTCCDSSAHLSSYHHSLLLAGQVERFYCERHRATLSPMTLKKSYGPFSLVCELGSRLLVFIVCLFFPVSYWLNFRILSTAQGHHRTISFSSTTNVSKMASKWFKVQEY